MTIAAADSTKKSYTLDGSVRTFAYPYPFQQKSDLVVVLRTIATGVDTTLTEGTDYNITAANDDYSSGAAITTVSTYTSASRLIVYRNEPSTQTYAHTDLERFKGKQVENAFDYLMKQVQQLKTTLARCLKFPIGDDSSSELEDEVDRASKYLSFDANGDMSFGSANPTNVTVKNSVEFDSGSIQLDGDAASPGNNKMYGTSGAGAKGFFDVPGTSTVTKSVTKTSEYQDAFGGSATIVEAVADAVANSRPLLVDQTIEVFPPTSGRVNLPAAATADQDGSTGQVTGIPWTTHGYQDGEPGTGNGTYIADVVRIFGTTNFDGAYRVNGYVTPLDRDVVLKEPYGTSGTIGFKIRDHRFIAGQKITVTNTINYNRDYTVHADTTDNVLVVTSITPPPGGEYWKLNIEAIRITVSGGKITVTKTGHGITANEDRVRLVGTKNHDGEYRIESNTLNTLTLDPTGDTEVDYEEVPPTTAYLEEVIENAQGGVHPVTRVATFKFTNSGNANLLVIGAQYVDETFVADGTQFEFSGGSNHILEDSSLTVEFDGLGSYLKFSKGYSPNITAQIVDPGDVKIFGFDDESQVSDRATCKTLRTSNICHWGAIRSSASTDKTTNYNAIRHAWNLAKKSGDLPIYIPAGDYYTKKIGGESESGWESLSLSKIYGEGERVSNLLLGNHENTRLMQLDRVSSQAAWHNATIEGIGLDGREIVQGCRPIASAADSSTKSGTHTEFTMDTNPLNSQLYNHGFEVGDLVTIGWDGGTGTDYSGDYSITAIPSGTVFEVAVVYVSTTIGMVYAQNYKRNIYTSVTDLSGAAVNINNAAAREIFGTNLVGIPATAHGFENTDSIVIAGTTNYDGSYDVHHTSSANEIIIIAQYVAETFAGGGAETVKLNRTGFNINNHRMAVGMPVSPQAGTGADYSETTALQTYFVHESTTADQVVLNCPYLGVSTGGLNDLSVFYAKGYNIQLKDMYIKESSNTGVEIDDFQANKFLLHNVESEFNNGWCFLTHETNHIHFIDCSVEASYGGVLVLHSADFAKGLYNSRCDIIRLYVEAMQNDAVRLRGVEGCRVENCTGQDTTLHFRIDSVRYGLHGDRWLTSRNNIIDVSSLDEISVIIEQGCQQNTIIAPQNVLTRTNIDDRDGRNTITRPNRGTYTVPFGHYTVGVNAVMQESNIQELSTSANAPWGDGTNYTQGASIFSEELGYIAAAKTGSINGPTHFRLHRNTWDSTTNIAFTGVTATMAAGTWYWQLLAQVPPGVEVTCYVFDIADADSLGGVPRYDFTHKTWTRLHTADPAVSGQTYGQKEVLLEGDGTMQFFEIPIEMDGVVGRDLDFKIVITGGCNHPVVIPYTNFVDTMGAGFIHRRKNVTIGYGIEESSIVAGITASTTQTQAAATQLYASHNVVGTTANANDCVKLPLASGPIRRVTVRNDGAQVLDVFPASGDEINGLGADLPLVGIAATGGNQEFVVMNSTHWQTTI